MPLFGPTPLGSKPATSTSADTGGGPTKGPVKTSWIGGILERAMAKAEASIGNQIRRYNLIDNRPRLTPTVLSKQYAAAYDAADRVRRGGSY